MTPLSLLFPGDSEMATRMRAFDWPASEFGPAERWPENLRVAVSLCLGSAFPILLWWGPKLAVLYNDAYIPFLGSAKHPRMLGRPGRECWEEIWPTIGPMLEGVMASGRATWSEDSPFFFARRLPLEEVYVTFSYAPILAADGRTVLGVFCPCAETTEKVLGARRLDTLRRLAARSPSARTVDTACREAVAVLRENPHDVAFAAVYVVDDGNARLVASVLPSEDARLPASVSAEGGHDDNGVWPLTRVLRTKRVEQDADLPARNVHVCGHLWPDLVREAMVLPIHAAHEQLAGLLVVGASPRRPLDAAYRTFFELVAGRIGSAIADARAYQAERARAEALAEIDRAKTMFFSNVSHEFRTPLTLILGPLAELLLSPRITDDERTQLEILRRNATRLQKLVNGLLDFTRVGAGRMEPSYAPVDLAQLTRELASSFRSAFDRAGVRLVVDCPPLGEPVYVDAELWENIVLNLVSNAFKFTFEGEVRISLAIDHDHVTLRVGDTGVGIPATEVARVFERFHRVPGTRARSHEGSGIGLALAHELIQLHGGSVHVESSIGRGSVFTVIVPKGSAHLPEERIGAPRTRPSSATRAASFVEEALQWLSAGKNAARLDPMPTADGVEEVPPPRAGTERILVVDDNADMRAYLHRLLAPYWLVDVAEDGAKALHSARARPPDLVIADVMMPELDGLELLRELRRHASTATIPVVLLSARAGEEASVEGLHAGADDYIVKPFSARELLARVRAHIAMNRLRQEASRREQVLRADAEAARLRLASVLESISDGFIALDLDWHYTALNDRACESMGMTRGEILGRRIWDFYPDTIGTRFDEALRRAVDRQETVMFEYFHPARNRWYENRVYPSADGVSIFFGDVTERKRAEEDLRSANEALEQADRRKDEFLAVLGHELRNPLAAIMTGAEVLRLLDSSAPEWQQTSSMIDREVRQLARLLDDLLDVSRITAGQIVLRHELVDLRDLVNRAVQTTRAAFDIREHRLQLDLPGGALTVDADPARLVQVISNLLGNAAKYSDRQGLIRLTVTAAGPQAEVRVSDNGIGIAPDDLRRIFMLFSRGEGSGHRPEGGLGVGLTLSRRLMELHGGSLEASSEGPGRGSEFVLRLPLAPSGPDATRAPLQTETPTLPVQRRRILLVDDNESFSDAMARLLELMGHDVRTARDGTGAVAATSAFRPHLVLLDLSLPDKSGYEVTREIRKDPALARVIIAAMTGHGREQDKEHARAVGVDHHLTKPVNERDLQALIDRITDD